MRIPNVVRQAVVAGGVVCLTVVGGCSDSAPTGSDNVSEVTGAAAASLTAADVIVPGTTVGAFQPHHAQRERVARYRVLGLTLNKGARLSAGRV